MSVSGRVSTSVPVWLKQAPVWRLLAEYVYVIMSLLVAAVMIIGFGNEFGARTPRAPGAHPAIVYLHAIVSSGLVVLFVAQSALARARCMRLHRYLGVLGIALGGAMPVLAMATALSRTALSRNAPVLSFLVFQINDIVSFSIAFGLAVWWRSKPEIHRRLMLLAFCYLTSAAFGRFPAWLLPETFLWFYLGVDGLILVGVAFDLLVLKRLHPVYAFALPATLAAQVAALTIFRTAAPTWLAIARGLGSVLN